MKSLVILLTVYTGSNQATADDAPKGDKVEFKGDTRQSQTFFQCAITPSPANRRLSALRQPDRDIHTAALRIFG